MLRTSRAGQIGLAMACGAGLAACSLFVSTDGLQSGGDDGGTISDAMTTDVVADVKASDAAKDSSSPADGPTLGFCEQNPGHKICWDFDESTTVPTTDETNYVSTQLFVDSADSVSKPNSLVLKWPAGAGMNSSITDDITLGTTISVAMDIRLTSSDLTTGQLVPIYIVVPPSAGESQHSFYVQSYYGELDVTEGVMPDDGGTSNYAGWTLASPVPSDTWVHIEFSVDGTTGTVKMSYNGAPFPDGQAISGFSAGAGRVSVGAYTVSIPADITERLDNFLFDY